MSSFILFPAAAHIQSFYLISWEPSTSFGNGSEHILQRFWDRVDTGGRDINDAALFSKGDELYPQGPPSALCDRLT